MFTLPILAILLILLWLLSSLKTIFFWIYFWQLKEYHWGRFLAHIRSNEGKKIWLNRLFLAKAVLAFFYLLAGPCFFYVTVCLAYPEIPRHQNLNFISFLLIAFLAFSLETVKEAKDGLKRQWRFPVLTAKTVFLISASVAAVLTAVFCYWNQIVLNYPGQDGVNMERLAGGLMVLSFLLPLAVSLAVWFFQPITILIRNQAIGFAKRKRKEMKNLVVVGITGSYGKSSTKEFLYDILSTRFNVLKTKENQNSEIGIARTILAELQPKDEIFLAEMGAYTKGGIKFLCDIAKPQIGIVTGTNEQHLATFGSWENLLSAEGGRELIESLPKTGVAIFNAANDFIKDSFKDDNRQELKKRIFCSTKEAADYWIETAMVDKNEVSFRVFSSEVNGLDIIAPVVGGYNIENILMAIACARELGMTFWEISQACLKIKPENSALKLFKTETGIEVLDAVYSANPTGVLAHLAHLRLWAGKKAVVMPSLIELGPAAKKNHLFIGKALGETSDLAIITTEEGFAYLRQGGAEAGADYKINYLSDPQKIISKLNEFLRPGDVLLLESRVPKEVLAYFRKKQRQ